MSKVSTKGPEPAIGCVTQSVMVSNEASSKPGQTEIVALPF